MAQIIRVSTSTPLLRASVNNQSRTTIRTVGVSAESTNSKLANLTDVDASDPQNNETLVYDATAQKYVIKTLPVLDGGTY